MELIEPIMLVIFSFSWKCVWNLMNIFPTKVMKLRIFINICQAWEINQKRLVTFCLQKILKNFNNCIFFKWLIVTIILSIKELRLTKNISFFTTSIIWYLLMYSKNRKLFRTFIVIVTRNKHISKKICVLIDKFIKQELPTFQKAIRNFIFLNWAETRN